MKYQIISKKELEKIEPIIDKLTREELRQYIFCKWFYDKEFFTQYFLKEFGDIIEWKKLPTPAHHKEIWSLLDRWEDLNIIEPRGHGKTTAILIWILWTICYEQERAIIYVADGKLWEKWVGKIRRELENNEVIIEIFWNLVPTNSDDVKDKKLKKWRQKELEFINGCYLLTLSKGQSIRGQRPTKIIIDDPQENKDVENKKIVDKFNIWIFTSLYNTLLPWWSMCVLGTIVWNLCLVLHLKNEKKRETIYREACDENCDNPLRPELWSKEELIKRKKKIGVTLFNQEFRHIPLNKESALIKQERIRTYAHKPLKFEKIIMAVDPISKASDKSDKMWISVVGLSNDFYYVLYTKGVRLSTHKAETFIKTVYNKFEPNVVIQESNIENTMLENLRRDGLPIKPYRSSRDKYTRLLSVQYAFENWLILFRKEDKDWEVIRQLTNFPDVDHDDIMDSLVFCLLYENTKKSSRIRKV